MKETTRHLIKGGIEQMEKELHDFYQEKEHLENRLNSINECIRQSEILLQDLKEDYKEETV